MVLFRKDRVVQTAGADRLSEHRLKPDSPTRRMIATCCNTPMLLEFTKGHWLTFYRGGLPEEIPPLEMRVMTEDEPAAVNASQRLAKLREPFRQVHVEASFLVGGHGLSSRPQVTW